MSCSSKLTDKNSTIIPQEICESLELKAGDSIVFQVIDKHIVMIKKATGPQDDANA